jgi:hypothetical protein
MLQIRSRRDLSLLMERQMAAASARSGAPNIDDDIESRAALKVYLLEAHGRLRAEPLPALRDVCAPLGITVEPTHDPELLALQMGDLQLWMDVSGGRVCRLYTVGVAKDADRVHELLVAATGSLECVWLPPRVLEQLAKRSDARMVLFSLRHDRRALRRTPDDQGIDSVTLRFWGPRAKETLDKLRHSDVLPDATSVYSVRVRLGDDERYCLAEVFHSGKLTTVGTSFALLETVLSQLTEAHADLALSLEQAQRTPRRIDVKVRWTLDDLGYGVARMFSGAEPFRLWGVPEQSATGFAVRAVDLDVGRSARFEVRTDGVSLELGARTPASVAIRYISALQYHVNASIGDDLTSPEPLLQFALPLAAPPGPISERSQLGDVARVALPEVCALWVRGVQSISTAAVIEAIFGAEHGTEALHDLVRKVLTEAAAHEWRQWLKLVISPEGRTSWRFADGLPTDPSVRLRELVRLNRAAQQLVARMSGTGLARWLQLSLFGPESMVTPIVGVDEG